MRIHALHRSRNAPRAARAAPRRCAGHGLRRGRGADQAARLAKRRASYAGRALGGSSACDRSNSVAGARGSGRHCASTLCIGSHLNAPAPAGGAMRGRAPLPRRPPGKAAPRANAREGRQEAKAPRACRQRRTEREGSLFELCRTGNCAGQETTAARVAARACYVSWSQRAYGGHVQLRCTDDGCGRAADGSRYSGKRIEAMRVQVARCGAGPRPPF